MMRLVGDKPLREPKGEAERGRGVPMQAEAYVIAQNNTVKRTQVEPQPEKETLEEGQH